MIVFTGMSGSDYEIWRMNANGSGLTQLTNTIEKNRSSVYSPDGAYIAFSSIRIGDQEEVYMMNADGSGQVNLTNSPGSNDSYPDWTLMDWTRPIYSIYLPLVIR
jgi:TolB protein